MTANAALGVSESLWFAEQIRGLRNDYLEDPTWGLQGMRQAREKASMFWQPTRLLSTSSNSALIFRVLQWI